MAITPLPDPPSTSDRDSFDSRADAFLLALPTFATELNTVAEAMNLISLTTVSSTSHSAATGAKTFTVQSGKSFLDGMWVTIADDADPTKQMVAIVTSYSGTSLQVNVQWHSGFAGSLSDWIIAQCPPYNTNAINDEIFLITPNGCGSTDTLTRRYTTTVINSGGSSMSWSDSATLGGRLTINQTGLYAFHARDIAGTNVSITKNDTVFDITSAATLIYSAANDAITALVKCSGSDVIRVILNVTSAATSGNCFFRAKRIL